jgi:hypothetical protein
MSFEAERAAIETHFNTAWLLSAYASVPVIYENTNIKQPKDSDFLIHRIGNSDGQQMEIVGQADALHRYVGLVMVDILALPGAGTARPRAIADVVSEIYRRAEFSSVQAGRFVFRTPSIKSFGLYSERYRFCVTCPYRRDIHQ